MTKNKNNNAIWSTRIKKDSLYLVFQKVGNSIDIDKKLYKEDIAKDQLFMLRCYLDKKLYLLK